MNESSPLLESSDVSLLPSVSSTSLRSQLPTSSWTDCLFNLVNTAMGASTLALPYAFAQCGWLLGTMICIIIAFLNTVALLLLTKASEINGASGYIELARKVGGFRGEAIVTISMFLLLLSPLLAYLDITVDYIQYFSLLTFEQTLDKTIVSFLLMIFVILPICCIRSFKNVVSLSVVSIVALGCVIVMIPSSYFGSNVTSDAKAFNWNANIMNAVCTLSAAFINHTNHIEIVSDLINPTPKRKYGLVVASTLIVSIAYFIVGMAGYFHFGSNVSPNILNDEQAGVWFNGARILVAISVVLSYPVIMIPSRACIDWLLHNLLPMTTRDWMQTAFRKKRFYLITISILAVVYCLVHFIHGLDVIYGLFGAFTGSLVVYVFPSIIFLKSKEKPENIYRWLAYLNIAVGMFLFVFGTIYNAFIAF